MDQAGSATSGSAAARAFEQAAARAVVAAVDLSRPVVAAAFDLHAWAAWLAQAEGLLDADELTRIARLRRPSDRDARRGAYVLHRMLLGCYLRMPAAAVPLGRDCRGAPCLTATACWTSLSHADGLVAVAASRLGPVGVDIEPHARAAVMAEIRERVCTPAEATALATLPEHRRGAALLAAWVRKEALLKAAGVGLQVGMETFEAPVGEGVLLPDGSGRNACIAMPDAGAIGVAAVAWTGAARMSERLAIVPAPEALSSARASREP